MKPTFVLIIVFGCISILCGYGLDQIRPFQSYFTDGALAGESYVDGQFLYSNYDESHSWALGARGGYPIAPKVELQMGLQMGGWCAEQGNDDITGLHDPIMAARYQFAELPAKLAVCGNFTLPIGNEDLGENNFDFGLYGAARYPLNMQVDLLGTLGIDSREGHDNRKTALALTLGAICEFTPEFALVGELDTRSEWNWTMFSVGGDFRIPTGTHLRGQLGMGLDDGAPDVMFQFSVLFPGVF